MTKIQKYRILSHTADLRLEVYGKTLKELFTNATEALADILVGEKKPPLSYMIVVEKIELRSTNPNTLLVDFLNEILAKSQINKAVYKVKSISVIARSEATKQSLSVELSGVKVDKFEEDVKAITYHEVDIKKEGELYKTRLVLDI